jgi:hypothetical protein
MEEKCLFDLFRWSKIKADGNQFTWWIEDKSEACYCHDSSCTLVLEEPNSAWFPLNAIRFDTFANIQSVFYYDLNAYLYVSK